MYNIYIYISFCNTALLLRGLTWCRSRVQLAVMKTEVEREKWLTHSSAPYTSPEYSHPTWAQYIQYFVKLTFRSCDGGF